MYGAVGERGGGGVKQTEYLVKDARLVSIEVHHPNRPAGRGKKRNHKKNKSAPTK
jgi:hypothetical protein